MTLGALTAPRVVLAAPGAAPASCRVDVGVAPALPSPCDLDYHIGSRFICIWTVKFVMLHAIMNS